MLVSRVPAPPLSDFVELLWHASGWKPPHAHERHMPDGSVNLIFVLNPDGASRNAAMVSGPRSEASFIATAQPVTVMGAHFRRGGAAPFLDVSPSELANGHAALADVAGGSSLRDRLLGTHDAAARLDLLLDWLLDRLLRSPGRDHAIAWAVRQFERQPHVRVSAVADHIGRSSRWFVDRFSTEVGLTPKVFSRVQRFQFALRQLHEGTFIDLADLAAAAGYFDQAHFTHDFRSIAGITPTAYIAGRTEHANHVRDSW